jgi:uncharacterized membrane protein YphA (DoxX/SURF4 family)
MNKELEDLQHSVKRRFSNRINPQYSESFKPTIEEGQIIPLIQEVFRLLDWPIVYTDDKSVEAKRKNQWNKLTAKVTVTRKPSGRIEVHSKSLEGHLTDLGKNSKRTGLFIALFKKLEKEYSANDKIKELEDEFKKRNNWEDYDVPTTLPQPKESSEPNLINTIIGSFCIALSIGVIIGFLTYVFRHIAGIYELGTGLYVGHFLGKTLTKTNYIDYNHSKLIILGILLLGLVTNFFTQYILINYNSHYENFGFIDYLSYRFNSDLKLSDNLYAQWIGHIILWSLHIALAYFIALHRVTFTIIDYAITRIPSEVIDYTVYLLEKDNSLSEVRTLLAEKGWKKTSDQDQVFEAINELFGLQELNRE